MGNSTSTIQYSTSLNDINVEQGLRIIDTVFLCEQDYYYNDGHMLEKLKENVYFNKKFPFVKRSLKEFIKNIYGGNDHTIFRWSTWDVENADIISSNVIHNPNENVYDVVCSIGCPVIQFSQEHVNAICRLLRPDGLLIFFFRGGMHQKSLMQRNIEMQDFQYISIPNCEDRPFVPIARTPITNYQNSSEITVEVWKRR